MAVKGSAGKHLDLDFVLLCLMQMHEDVSGYQLHSFIEESTGYLYRAHLSQIYPALRRLRDEGLVTVTEVEREGKPNLKLYRITAKGAAAAKSWLVKPFVLENTRTSADRMFLKLVFMGHLEPASTIAYIDAGIANLTDQRNAHAANNMKKETEFLNVEDAATLDRYKVIWKHELDFVLSEYDLRIARLQQLRDELAKLA